MTLIPGLAVTSKRPAVPGYAYRIAKARLLFPKVADAMRPRVVRQHAPPVAESLLNREDQSIVGSRPAIVELIQRGIILSLRRVLQEKNAPLILVVRGRANGVVHAINRAGAQP